MRLFKLGFQKYLRFLPIIVVLGISVLVFVGSVPWAVWAGALAVLCLSVFAANRFRPVPFQASESRIEIDREGVRRVLGSKTVEQVRWNALVKVAIVTTDGGPLLDDFFFILLANDGTGCPVSLQKACEIDLLARLQQLPRFDNATAIEATGSTEWGEFLCWQGAAGEGLAASVPESVAPP